METSSIGFEFPKNFQVQGSYGEKGEALQKTNALKSGLSQLVRTKNNFIGMTFRLNMIVDAAKAADGELKLSIPHGMEIEFHAELEPPRGLGAVVWTELLGALQAPRRSARSARSRNST